jgi:hypothetical protein
MDISAAITWIFANPDIALYGTGGVAALVLLISLWGLRRTFRNRKAADGPPMVDEVLDRDEILAELTEPFEPEIAVSVSAEAPDEPAFEAQPQAADMAEDRAGETEEPFQALEGAADESEPVRESTRERTGAAPANDLRAIAETVFDANFPKLHADATAEARRNVGAFIDELASEAETRLSDAEIARFAKADIQLLLYGILGEVAKRHDAGKNGLLIGLLFGRVRHDDKPEIVELLDEAIEVCGRINTNYISVVVMCLYLRSIHLRSDDIAELETVVKYATGFGEGATFSNMRTGPLFSHGLLMYNAAMDRIEGQILRNYGPMFEVDPAGLEAYPGESPTSRQIVHDRLNLSPEQTRILETWGQSQCGRATATGIGWAAAAAYIERATGQPADWERMIL